MVRKMGKTGCVDVFGVGVTDILHNFVWHQHQWDHHKMDKTRMRNGMGEKEREKAREKVIMVEKVFKTIIKVAKFPTGRPPGARFAPRCPMRRLGR